ncbi:hypothetical protein ACFQE5_13230 [Pseudonocardia hispaniensis]|uniref:(2Fe-2S) ferredoxin n=1 Tax=Pseudonocardia hispaniensis TaxID=904933 RepID=A0ABW1J2W8_9PSEU
MTAAEGYTLVVCASASCRSQWHGQLVDALRAMVRASRHGMLVTSGCTLGRLACRLRAPGPLVLVQPCDARRRPTGRAVRIGPLSCQDDLAAVRTWIEARRFDPGLLPRHLVEAHRTMCAAAQN